MPAITRVDVVAAGPKMADIQYTDLLPAVLTTVTVAEIHDESGAVGVGAIESDSFGGFDLGPLEALRTIAPGLLGHDSHRPGLIRELAQLRMPSTSRSVPCAALEIASWDLLARHAGLPLCQLLGGARTEVPVYASLPFERDLAAQCELLDRAFESGYSAVKLHVSGDPQADAARAEELRSAYPALELMLDAEGGYDRRGAAHVGRALDRIGARWFEAPLPDRDVEGYRALTRALDVPVIPAGGVINDLREFASILRREPWSALRTQTMEGGVGYVVEVAALARAFGVDLELTSYGTSITQAIDLHVMLGLGVGSYYEQPFPADPWQFGTLEPVVVERGVARAPGSVGLGIELDRDAIAATRLGSFTVEA